MFVVNSNQMGPRQPSADKYDPSKDETLEVRFNVGNINPWVQARPPEADNDGAMTKLDVVTPKQSRNLREFKITLEFLGWGRGSAPWLVPCSEIPT